MKEQSKEKLVTKYPEWHEKPLRLSLAEMEDPYRVLSDFFARYSLPAIHTYLGEILQDPLRRDMEKMTEAVWVICHKTQKEEMAIVQNNTPAEEKGYEEALAYITPLHDFFDYCALPDAHKYFISACKAAGRNTIWKKNSPADLMHFFDMLQTLVAAVFSMEKKAFILKKVILPEIPDIPDLTQYHVYCGTHDQYTPWHYVPRSLGIKEYRNPYKALQKFTTFSSKKQWKKNLQLLLEFALSNHCLAEMAIDIDLTGTMELLQKMLDACHLIVVRASLQKKLL